MQDVLRRGWFVGGVGIVVSGWPILLQAQTTVSVATISGTVVDPDGKVVTAAAVVVKNDLTGASRSATTTEEGRFLVSALPVGSYTVEVSAPGFTTARSA